jgi:hypothetical protein
MRMEDKLKIIGFFLTAAGLLLTAWQIYKARVQQRAQYILDHFTAYVRDPELANVFNRLQFGSFTYPEDFHEVHTDRLLNHFSRIITLYEIGAVSKRDLRCLTMSSGSSPEMNDSKSTSPISTTYTTKVRLRSTQRSRP